MRSLTEAIDTTTSGGRLIFHIFAALAEFERSIIREHTMASLAAARARGQTGGRPPALGDADIEAAKALLADPAITAGQVDERLGVSLSTLYRHLPGARDAHPWRGRVGTAAGERISARPQPRPCRPRSGQQRAPPP